MKEIKKVSIVVPCYNTSKYARRCIESILNQTYTNFELVLVNDCSTDSIPEILNEYEKKDHRIIIVNNKQNLGLFKARLAGADVCKGDYICFIDSDDYISKDYLRNLVSDLETKNADMVFCNTVIEENNRRFVYNLFDFHQDQIADNDCLDEYFKQEGVCYRWHTVWNKLYSMSIWKKARKYYDGINEHLIMAEDFAFSTVLFFFTKKIVFNEYANYYYCSNDEASTSLSIPNFNKFNKNINDIFVSFDFVKKFLKEKKVYNKYKKNYNQWYRLYIKIWYDNVNNSGLNIKDKESLISILKKAEPNIEKFQYHNELNFYNGQVEYNDGYEKIVEQIINNQHKIISFDLFDTLIVRPFFEPKDLFKLLNKLYGELCPTSSLVFSDIREISENICRNNAYKNNYYEEVTLDEIYDCIKDDFRINNSILNKLKKKEIELELRYCKVRKSGKNLYTLAKHLNKKIIVTSDIYLPRTVIEKILKNNGYDNIDRIYLSCEEKLSKSTKQLFKIVITQENNISSNILHIGDNYYSDYLNPKDLDIHAMHLPKAIDAFLPYVSKIFLSNEKYIDTDQYLSYSGIRNSIALIANKFFDNPYISFDKNSEFNCNPELVGYFAFGMHLFALGIWLYNDLIQKEYDSITFMARDGYVLKKIFDKMISKRNYKIETNYLPISRKSLITYSFEDASDFIKIIDYYEYDKTSSDDIYDMMLPILNSSEKKSKLTFKNKEDFINFLQKDIIPNIDSNKLETNRIKLKKYFSQFYIGKSANFDIGYSGKPESTLTKLLNKQIDTYFVHTNDNNGFYYSNTSHYNLTTFYDYKPKFTGLLREYMFSELKGSCNKYDIIDDGVKIVYDDFQPDYYEQWILNIIQNAAVNFSNDFMDLFNEYLNEIYFPKYYMSIPFEYFLHCASEIDRKIFCNLKFENTLNDFIDINSIWSNVVENSNQCNTKIVTVHNNSLNSYDAIVESFYDIKVKHRNKFIKLVYYLLYDRVTLKAKIKNKCGENNLTVKIIRKIYRLLKK